MVYSSLELTCSIEFLGLIVFGLSGLFVLLGLATTRADREKDRGGTYRRNGSNLRLGGKGRVVVDTNKSGNYRVTSETALDYDLDVICVVNVALARNALEHSAS